MGAWYWIGVLAGIGVALGMLAAGIVLRWPPAAVIGGVAAVALAIALFAWPEALAGGAGAVAGAFGTAIVATGALRRGGTRAGVALLIGVAAVAGAAIAFIPVAGVLEAVAMPVIALRLRRKTPERYAGLRTLARD
jgi:hypothetical protein